jgi:superfamily II DNA helicase RecQ
VVPIKSTSNGPSRYIMNDNSTFKFEGSTIIYCNTRKLVEEVYEVLKAHKFDVGFYHAGCGLKERTMIHEAFSRDDITCIVATIAFGMGIDKPDVRNVIHYG